MTTSPIRQLLFLGVLLFVILSSGSLQCALNCYDHSVRLADSATFATDCHPLDREDIRPGHLASFCHRSHAASQAQGDPIMRSYAAAPALALLNVREDAPPCRNVEQIAQPLIAQNGDGGVFLPVLPPSQSLRQLRSTVLLM